MCIRDRLLVDRVTGRAEIALNRMPGFDRDAGVTRRNAERGREGKKIGVVTEPRTAGLVGVDDVLDVEAVEQPFRRRLDARILGGDPVSYTHLRAHETVLDLVCRLLLEKKKKK